MRIPKPILERRRSVRLEEALPFKIGLEGFEQEAATLNVSSHGAMCLLEKDIPMMTKLSMVITLFVPSQKISFRKKRNIHLKGVVVRKEIDPATGQFQTAIFFSDITAEDQEVLDEYILSRLKK